MEACFECYCEYGLAETSAVKLAAACKMSDSNLFKYFDTMDDIIIECTAHCMAKVEDDFMLLAPKNAEDINRFLDEAPEWTRKKHGKAYRFMYQVYTSPKYHEYGKIFFEGVTRRYTEYAKRLEPLIQIPWQAIQPMIFTFVRASVHYALFEEKEYLTPQIEMLRTMLKMYSKK